MIAELTPIEETAVGRELIGIGMERGMKQGKAQGKAQGIEIGKEQLLARIIRAKFSRVPASVLKQITGLPVDALDDLAVALLKMPDLAALKTWISRR